MKGRTPSLGFSLFGVLLVCSAQGAPPPPTLPLSGSISGAVKNATGIVQMGAAVALYNRYDRFVRQAITDANGGFVFDALSPDLYSIRVSLSSFVPALKRNISVQPGLQSVLTINMSGMLSTVELTSVGPAKGSLMAPDWKWVLRSAQSTRPILRIFDENNSSSSSESHTHVFSETRGLLKVSAGDNTSFAGPSAQPDLGTAFALATSIFGSNQVQVSGNVGYSARSGLPTAGFRTTYSRDSGLGSGPELTVTMHQVYLPARNGFGNGPGDPGPALRTATASMVDELNILDNIKFEYGVSGESISLMNRLNMISPFARLTYDFGTAGSLQVAYSAGGAPIELAARNGASGARESGELQEDLVALGSLPMVSLRDGVARVQRTQNMEAGYHKVQGSRTYSLGLFRERVTDGALTMANSADLFGGDVLPDFGSRSGIFNIGNFNRWGYLASVTQSLGERLEVEVAYGRGGMLTMGGRTLGTGDADELRSLVKVAERNWASARIAGTAPVTGTHFAASYGWADYRSLMPAHLSLTQRNRPEPGLNLSIRQPIPAFGFFPGRFEATAELRNLLEQGYLPVTTVDGGIVLLTNAPRAVRGGLSFIF